MSETNPVLIVDGNGHTPTALGVVLDYIRTVCPGEEDTVSGAYKIASEGFQRFAELLPGGEVIQTFGTVVKAEVYRIAVSVIGPGMDETQDEMMRLRYLLISAGGAYASRGLELINVDPIGTIKHLGPDANGRQMIESEFYVMTGPSYT